MTSHASPVSGSSRVAELMAEWPGLAEHRPTDATVSGSPLGNSMPRAVQILHAHLAVAAAIERRDMLLAEAQDRKVPVRVLSDLIGVPFTTIARWTRRARNA